MSTIHNVQGNNYRDVWKNVCWNMAQDVSEKQFAAKIKARCKRNVNGM